MFSRLFLWCAVLLMTGQLYAQMTNEGYPKSWSAKTLPTKIDQRVLPAFDRAEVDREDVINDAAWDRPWRFGYSHNVAYNLNNSGTWNTLPNGDRIWQLQFVSNGAITMNAVFSDFYLPDGATVYLFNPVTNEHQGAYTSANNNPDRVLGTTLLAGDELIVEYYEPAAVRGQGALQVGQVVHGYRTSKHYPMQRLAKGLNDAGDCNIDVNCPLGTGWQDQINSVALLVAGGNGFCTGALINNTANDGTPYFLTANHCLGGGPAAWVFRFNWDSPTTSCATTAPSQAPPGPRNEVNGAVTRASNGGTDVALLELNTRPTGSIYYAGWDRSATPATEATGIHHPSGDVKKICREDDPVTASTMGSASVWEVADWDQGVTEPGSSGSPLFNQNQLIIGQLFGGGAACNGTTDNGRDDNYGRFDISWNNSGSASGRLRDWLDPNGSNVTTLLGYDPNGPALSIDAGVLAIAGIEDDYCNTDTIEPQVEFFNYGTSTINSVEIRYNVDGGPFSTYNWTGTLPPNNSATVTLPRLAVGAGPHTFSAETNLPNNSTDSNAVNNVKIYPFYVTLAGVATTFFLELDCYGDEISWEITDDVQTRTIATGGNYSNNFSSIDTIIAELCLDTGCYRLAIFDSYGDGLDGTAGSCGRTGSYGVYDEYSNNLVTMTAVNGNFGRSVEHFFCVQRVIGVNEPENNHQLRVFPNPTTGEFFVNLDLAKAEEVQLRLYSVTGQELWQNTPATTTSTTLSVDLSDQPTGVYWIQVQIGDELYTEKVVRQ